MTIKINITAAELVEFQSALSLTSEPSAKEFAVAKRDCPDEDDDAVDFYDAADATADILDFSFVDQMNERAAKK